MKEQASWIFHHCPLPLGSGQSKVGRSMTGQTELDPRSRRCTTLLAHRPTLKLLLGKWQISMPQILQIIGPRTWNVLANTQLSFTPFGTCIPQAIQPLRSHYVVTTPLFRTIPAPWPGAVQSGPATQLPQTSNNAHRKAARHRHFNRSRRPQLFPNIPTPFSKIKPKVRKLDMHYMLDSAVPKKYPHLRHLAFDTGHGIWAHVRMAIARAPRHSPTWTRSILAQATKFLGDLTG